MKRVLVVHNDSDFRRIYSAVLEHAGFTVADTDDPATVRAAFDEPVSLVICDLYLNGIGDESFVSWLHRDIRCANVPVMVLTAWSSETHESVAVRNGAEAFLRLPVPPKTLLHEVMRILGPASSIGSVFSARLTSPPAGSPVQM